MEDCGGVVKKSPKGKQRLLDLTNDRPLASFTAKLRADPQHFRLIIGKNGANIKKIKDSTGARFEFPSSTDDDREVITIIGKDNKSVNEAKTQLEEMIKKLDNNVKGEMQVEPRHHKHFVARKGEVLHRIADECRGVRISFPRSGDASDRVTLKLRADPQHFGLIIGKNGANIKKIRDSTGARFEFPSSTDDDREVITIIGKDKESVNEAKTQLEEMIKKLDNNVKGEMQVEPRHHKHFVARKGEVLHRIADECRGVRISFPRSGDASDRVTLKLRADPQHFGLIIGKNGANIKKIRDSTGARFEFPSSTDDDREVITIIGKDKESVNEAKTQLEEMIKKLDNNVKCGGVRISFPRSGDASDRVTLKFRADPQHFGFIIGKNGANIKNIKDSTGARFEFPSSTDDDREVITIIGKDKKSVDEAKTQLEEMIKKLDNNVIGEMQVEPRHHKHFVARKGEVLRRIADECGGVRISFPRSDDASDRVTLKLRADPQHFGLIIGKNGANIEKIRDSTGARFEFPSSTDDDREVITIIGKDKKSVNEAKTQLEEMIKKLDNNVKREMQVEPRHHKHFVARKGEVLCSIPDECGGVRISFPRSGDASERVTLKLRADPQHFGLIIGKNDADIKKIRDSTGARFEFPSSTDDDREVITIIGKDKKSVNEAKTQLEEMIKKLDNNVKREMQVEPRHHKHFVARKGEVLRSIPDECGGVRISFPRSGDASDLVTLKLRADPQHFGLIIGKNGADIKKIRDSTGARFEFPSSTDDDREVITIIGKDKKSVNEAKTQLEEMIKKLDNNVKREMQVEPRHHKHFVARKGEVLHSIPDECGDVRISFPRSGDASDLVTLKLRADPQHFGLIIGKNGANIKKIRDSTGARFEFPSSTDDDREVITIIGKDKKAVNEAKTQLEEMIKKLDNNVIGEMQVEPRHHKHFVARKGEVLHSIPDECGGVRISFPRSGDASERVTLKGNKESIKAAKARINKIVEELESMVTIDCVIPQKHHRKIRRAKGYNVEDVISEFDVQIEFPDKDNQEEYVNHDETIEDIFAEPVRLCDVIRITGKELNCEQARQALLDLVPLTINVDVPFDLHRSITRTKGRDVRALRNRYNVQIMLSPSYVQEDVISITGTPTNVERAKEAILERVKELEEEKRRDRELGSFVLKIEVNPDYNPKIIKKRGAIITKIKKDHDVQINFPKKGDTEEFVITITGYEENTYKAKEAIMEMVNELNDLVREEVKIDSRVHSRLTGAKRRNIRKIMEDYHVDIKFPKSENSDLVIISGQKENVMDARKHLLNLEEECLQE